MERRGTGGSDGKFEKRYRLAEPVRKAEFERERDWWNRHRLEKEIHESDGKPMNPDYCFRWDKAEPEYSYIYRYPKNIRPDWKALLEECRQMMEADGITV